jgi:prepilin signal peptidase PulO-like enzyme (type II secretory pathway)
MTKRYNLATIMGVLLYVLYSVVDRFLVKIPDVIAIPAMVVGLVFIVCGLVMERKKS